MDCSYIVTVKDVGNITNEPGNIHTILTSTDNIQPRERVTVRRWLDKPLGLNGARMNPSFTPELEATIKTCVEMSEEDGATIIAMMPVKKYTADRAWEWDGFVLIESDGDTREFNMEGICQRASSAYEVPR